MKNSTVALTRKQVALDVWQFGEDAYVQKVFQLSDEELNCLGDRAYVNFNEESYKKSKRDMPTAGYDIGLIVALTTIEYFEGEMRPLKRLRRRSRAYLPKELIATMDDYLTKPSKIPNMKIWMKRIFSRSTSKD